MQPSAIKVFETRTGTALPSAPQESVLSSSTNLGWRGIKVELHRLAPAEMPEHYIDEHRLIVQTGPPVLYEWKSGARWRQTTLNPGDFNLQTHGDINAPRWSGEFEFLAIAVDPAFVARALRDAVSPHKITFRERRGGSDPVISRLASHFKRELEERRYLGALYGESLAMAFSLHLLERHGVWAAAPKLPKGRLTSAQLGRVTEFVHENLSDDLSIEGLAGQAFLSPFHFSRLFKNTVGLSPHQYVLRSRVERAKRLLVTSPRLGLAEVSLSVGFYDQAHFTHAFSRFAGVPPRAFQRDTAL